MHERCRAAPWLVAWLVVECTVAAASSPMEIPDPDTSAFELQVREKLEQTRARVRSEPQSAEAWGLLAMTFHIHGLESEALASYQEAIRLDPANFRWPYLLAYLLKIVDVAKAQVFAERAVELNPEYVPGHVLLAEFREQEKQTEAAIAAYERALVIDPGCAPAEFGLGRLNLGRGRLEISVRHLERARTLAPNARPVRAFLARAYHRLGREEDATRENELASELTSTELPIQDPLLQELLDEAVSTHHYFLRAEMAEKSGDLTTALQLFQRILELYPNDPAGHYNMGSTLFRHGRADEAEPFLKRTVELHPPHGRANLMLGMILISRGLDDAAMVHLREPVALESEDGSILREMASLAWQDGRSELAIALLGRSLELEPVEGTLRILGQILVGQGRLDEAIRYYRSFFEQQPGSGRLHGELASLLIRAGNFREAWREVHAAESSGASIPVNDLETLRRALPDPGP